MVYKTYVINEDTDEATIAEGGRYYSNKQLESYHKKKIAEQKYIDYGAFVFLLFDYNQVLLPNISPASLTRIIFISTFLNYKGYLSFENGKPIDKQKLIGLLNLGQSTFKRFWNEMIQNDILKEENGLLYLNSELFYKGNVEKINRTMTRICVDGVRKLYTKADITSHKTLSYIFKILPFINIQNNIACHNPQEIDINLIQHLTLGEFCDIVGYDRSKTKRLMSDLFNCTFDGKTAMRYVSDKYDMQTWRIFVNPKIYYGGNDWKYIEILGGF